MTLAVEPGATTAGHLGDAIWIAASNGMVAVTRDGETWRRTPPRS